VSAGAKDVGLPKQEQPVTLTSTVRTGTCFLIKLCWMQGSNELMNAYYCCKLLKLVRTDLM
jgi:hypothetical protein